MKLKNRIVLNVPHSSVGALETARWRQKTELVNAANVWTDWHTNIIFRPDERLFSEKDVQMHVFGKSRFVVDAERLVDDPMEAIGQGIVYEKYDCRPVMDLTLTRKVSWGEKRALYKERKAFLAGIEKAILKNDRKGYGNVLIDCHSFPPFMGEVDVCLGYNEDESKPSRAVFREVKRIFNSAGFAVGVNTPFANSLQPVSAKNLARLDEEYCSLRIDVNKKVYLVEGGVDLKPEWTQFEKCVNDVYKFLTETDLNPDSPK